MPWTHRDRVAAALNHEAPDRCPMQISFTPEFAARLRAEKGGQARFSGGWEGGQAPVVRSTLRAVPEKGACPPFPQHNPHGGGNTYELERALDEDMLLTSVGWANCYYQQAEPYTDEWGIRWKPCTYQTKFGSGYYTEVAAHPLADDAAVDSYRPPDPARPELYREAERLVAEHGREYWIVGVTVTTIFEAAWALRGLSRLLMDFVENPELAGRILDIPFRYHLAAARRLVEIGVDMIWIGDDVGSQKGMMISPAAWRTFLKPRMAEFVAALKTLNPAVKIAYHSDGNVGAIVPELIEIGIDVLNPIQPACMDPAEVKKQFGRQLCFWGSLDEQHTLPFGSPDDVRREVRGRLETIGRGGGLILGPTHHVQLDTPMENFWAMVHTITGTPYPS
jgi:uroporphyrinogen decarboxylase